MSEYLQKLEGDLALAERKVSDLKQRINTEKMKMRENDRLWPRAKLPESVLLAFDVIGQYINTLHFDDLPRRVRLGKSQFKFVSREE